MISGALLAWKYYRWIYAGNTQATSGEEVIYVQQGDGYHDLLETLTSSGILRNEKAFRWVARRMKFGDGSVKPGRYVIHAGMNNYDILHKIRLGNEDPVQLVISTTSTIEDLAGRIARQIGTDSSALLSYVIEEYLPKSAYSRENLLSLFIPNTYSVFWTVSPSKLMDRMEAEHDKFWNDRRRKAAEDLSLRPDEVYTLASIVERETLVADERPVIAGVYLNRLHRGMLLQADPTVVFALGDSSIRRVLLRHLEIDSPYNTYRYAGLPPGPITMPSTASIDAVLFAEEHDYLFFCARPGYDGRHAFARTLSAHLTNAREYQRWLDSEGIR